MTSTVKEIGHRVVQSIQRDDVPGLAAQLAYRFLFALFPFGLFVAALGAFVAAWLGMDNPAERIVQALGDNLPPDIARAIQPELEHVVNNTRPGLLSFGALGALWAATGGTLALIKSMNRAYDVEESRPVPYRLALAVGLTILAGAGILVSFVTIVGGALLTQELAESLGVGAQAYMLITIARWPAILALLVVAVAILFRLAPNLKAPWRWTLLGASVFALGWLAATAGFAFYVGNFGNYGATYGSLGGVIVLMLWFYLTGLLLVGSAEVTAAAASVIEPGAIEVEREKARHDKAEQDREREEKRRHGNGPLDRLRRALGGEAEASNEDGRPRERRMGPPDRRRGGLQPQR